MPKEKIIKVVILGGAGTGKTHLQEGLINNEFIPSYYHPTIGVNFTQMTTLSTKMKALSNVRLNIWDTSGDENFKLIIASYTQGSDIVIFVFNDEESFQKIKEKLTTVPKGAKRILVNMQADRHQTGVDVTPEAAESFALQNEMSYFYVTLTKDPSRNSLKNFKEYLVNLALQIANELNDRSSNLVKTDEKSRKKFLADVINNFAQKHRAHQSAKHIADALKRILEDSNPKQVYNNEEELLKEQLWELQKMSKSLAATAANVIILVLGTLFCGAIPLAYYAGYFESIRNERGNSFMFFSGEKQDAEQAIEKVRQFAFQCS